MISVHLCIYVLFQPNNYAYPFMIHRKSLNKGVLLYVHLNLAIALLIALIIFVAGIETATPVPVSTVHSKRRLTVSSCIFAQLNEILANEL